ncbi:MAG: hypothetical protein ACTSRP_11165, partial [Candidatus Helarchaeota archaeon]
MDDYIKNSKGSHILYQIYYDKKFLSSFIQTFYFNSSAPFSYDIDCPFNTKNYYTSRDRLRINIYSAMGEDSNYLPYIIPYQFTLFDKDFSEIASCSGESAFYFKDSINSVDLIRDNLNWMGDNWHGWSSIKNIIGGFIKIQIGEYNQIEEIYKINYFNEFDSSIRVSDNILLKDDDFIPSMYIKSGGELLNEMGNFIPANISYYESLINFKDLSIGESPFFSSKAVIINDYKDHYKPIKVNNAKLSIPIISLKRQEIEFWALTKSNSLTIGLNRPGYIEPAYFTVSIPSDVWMHFRLSHYYLKNPSQGTYDYYSALYINGEFFSSQVKMSTNSKGYNTLELDCSGEYYIDAIDLSADPSFYIGRNSVPHRFTPFGTDEYLRNINFTDSAFTYTENVDVYKYEIDGHSNILSLTPNFGSHEIASYNFNAPQSSGILEMYVRPDTKQINQLVYLKNVEGNKFGAISFMDHEDFTGLNAIKPNREFGISSSYEYIYPYGDDDKNYFDEGGWNHYTNSPQNTFDDDNYDQIDSHIHLGEDEKAMIFSGMLYFLYKIYIPDELVRQIKNGRNVGVKAQGSMGVGYDDENNYVGSHMSIWLLGQNFTSLFFDKSNPSDAYDGGWIPSRFYDFDLIMPLNESLIFYDTNIGKHCIQILYNLYCTHSDFVVSHHYDQYFMIKTYKIELIYMENIADYPVNYPFLFDDASEKWHRLKYIWDCNQGTYSIYVDDAPFILNYPMPIANSPVMGFSIEAINQWENGVMDSVYVDAIGASFYGNGYHIGDNRYKVDSPYINVSVRDPVKNKTFSDEFIPIFNEDAAVLEYNDINGDNINEIISGTQYGRIFIFEEGNNNNKHYFDRVWDSGVLNRYKVRKIISIDNFYDDSSYPSIITLVGNEIYHFVYDDSENYFNMFNLGALNIGSDCIYDISKFGKYLLISFKNESGNFLEWINYSNNNLNVLHIMGNLNRCELIFED